MDQLTLASIAAQKAGMSYGKYMASMHNPVVVDAVAVPKKRLCPVCGKQISKYAHGSRRYCSDPCRYEAGRRSTLDRYHQRVGHTDEDRPKRVCGYCGKAIPMHIHGSNRYCSPECKHERELERARAKWVKRKDKVNEKRRAMRNGHV